MNYTKGLLSYIDKATTAVRAVSTGIEMLEKEGFRALDMGDTWMVEPGGSYYLRPYPSTLIAFTVGSTKFVQCGYHIITSHTDSPSFRVKGKAEVPTNGFMKLNVDVYGGPILYSWFDRPLSMAGQVILKSDDLLKPKVVEVDFKRSILTIPSLAIHFERKTNEGLTFDRQKNLLPIMQMMTDELEKEDYLLKVIAKEIGCDVAEILDFDLFIYNNEKGEIIGYDETMISAPRIDNLAMVYSSIEALIESKHHDGINLIACFDNEEIGSATKQGADSMLLHKVVERISIALKKQPEQRYRMYDSSFIISCDGAHASHPNAVEKNDITNEVHMGKGVTIKFSINQQYSTDAISSGAFMQLCEKADVPVQKMYNRSGIRGGLSMGPLVDKYLPMRTVDVGIPMLAMHSARELASVTDLNDCIKVLKTFFTD